MPRRDLGLLLSCASPKEGTAESDISSRWAPAQRKELVILGCYFALVILVTDILNIRPGIEVCIAMVILAATAISTLPALFFRDWTLFLGGMVMWNLSGPIAAQSPFPWHLNFMYEADRFLFAGHDPVVLLRDAFHAGPPLNPFDFVTSAVYNFHLPEPFIVAYFLWRVNRVIYFQFVAAALVLLVLGLLTFVLFPAVPPWMAGEPLVAFRGQYLRPWIAAAAGYPGGLRAAWTHSRVFLPHVTNGFGAVLASHPLPFVGSPIFYIFKFRGDQVAAFPSEHAAFPLLEYLAIRAAAPRFSPLMLIWVVLVLFTILYLGEHWLTDAIAGYVYAVAVWNTVRWNSIRLGRFTRFSWRAF